MPDLRTGRSVVPTNQIRPKEGSDLELVTSIGHVVILSLLGVVSYFLKRAIADLDNLEAKIEKTRENLDEKLTLTARNLDNRFQGLQDYDNGQQQDY